MHDLSSLLFGLRSSNEGKTGEQLKVHAELPASKLYLPPHSERRAQPTSFIATDRRERKHLCALMMSEHMEK